MPNIIICRTCTPHPGTAEGCDKGQAILDALEATEMRGTFSLSYVDCMGACTEPTAIAFQGTGLATFLFSGISVETDIEDIIKTCRTYLESPNGWIEDAHACGRLRECLHARIPALDVP